MKSSTETIEVRVASKTCEALNICSFELVSLNGEPLPAFQAGAHLDVHVPGSEGLVRQYSLLNSSRERHRYVIAVLCEREGRGGSSGMHDKVNRGDVIRIGTPRNHFALAEEAEESILIAGGIGITPILSMADALHHADKQFKLLYCARTPEHMAFRQQIQQGPYATCSTLHFSLAEGATKLDFNRVLSNPCPGRHLYVCGPASLLDAVTSTARSLGWAEENIHFEFFSNSTDATEGGEAFELRLAKSGTTITVKGDETVLQALARTGIEVPFSCEQGVCGTCLTKVIEGIPDHKDVYLTPAEQARNDQFLPCCSRSKTRVLTVDL